MNLAGLLSWAQKGRLATLTFIVLKGIFILKLCGNFVPLPLESAHIQTHQNEYMKLSVTVRCVDRVARVLYFQGRDV